MKIIHLQDNRFDTCSVEQIFNIYKKFATKEELDCCLSIRVGIYTTAINAYDEINSNIKQYYETYNGNQDFSVVAIKTSSYKLNHIEIATKVCLAALNEDVLINKMEKYLLLM